MNILFEISHTTERKTKYAAIFINTEPESEPALVKLVIQVSIIIPIMSSIIAAPKIVVPIFPLSFPISLSVSTVIDTDVAVSTTPINIAFRNSNLFPGVIPKKYLYTKKPPIRGIITPIIATNTDAVPFFLTSSISVSKPARNINRITPISAVCSINRLLSTILNPDGPKSIPAVSAPTTAGICTFLDAIPNTFVESNMIASTRINS